MSICINSYFAFSCYIFHVIFSFDKWKINMKNVTWKCKIHSFIASPKANVALTTTNTEMNWTKRWNWSSCTKLALRASWIHHGLITQLVRGSARNSVVVGSSTNQANFLQLLPKILQWWIPYIYYIILYNTF